MLTDTSRRNKPETLQTRHQAARVRGLVMTSQVLQESVNSNCFKLLSDDCLRRSSLFISSRLCSYVISKRRRLTVTALNHGRLFPPLFHYNELVDVYTNNTTTKQRRKEIEYVVKLKKIRRVSTQLHRQKIGAQPHSFNILSFVAEFIFMFVYVYVFNRHGR